jgi:hypothetical protein
MNFILSLGLKLEVYKHFIWNLHDKIGHFGEDMFV